MSHVRVIPSSTRSLRLAYAHLLRAQALAAAEGRYELADELGPMLEHLQELGAPRRRSRAGEGRLAAC